MINQICAGLTSFVLAWILAGCTSVSHSEKPCIKTSLVSSLSALPLSHFVRGDSRQVSITGFESRPAPGEPDISEHEKDTEINFDLSVPAKKQVDEPVRKVCLPVFVALLDKDNNVLDRMDQKITVKLNHLALNHPCKIIYRVPEEFNGPCENYHILVGFNETRIPAPKQVVKLIIKPKQAQKKYEKKNKTKEQRNLQMFNRA